MKVPPKRKGNAVFLSSANKHAALNESPSEKEGKCVPAGAAASEAHALNESPSEKEGKCLLRRFLMRRVWPSMKVPPKRKGNRFTPYLKYGGIVPSMKVPPKRKGNSSPIPSHAACQTLNESPSEKEGKWVQKTSTRDYTAPPQ